MMMLALVCAAEGQSPADRFFDEYYFPYNPTAATSAGIHKYDDKLEDYSKAANSARLAALKKFEAEFAQLPGDADRDLVLHYIRASLFELETVRMWQKNPDVYSSGICNSAFVIMSRKFAAPELRLKALTARVEGAQCAPAASAMIQIDRYRFDMARFPFLPVRAPQPSRLAMPRSRAPRISRRGAAAP